MEKVIDIRPIKKKMRAEAREMRRAMSPDSKRLLDRKIKRTENSLSLKKF